MAIDFADLALRVDYSQVDKGTKALEGLAAAGAKAEQSTNRVGVSSIAQTRNMGAWAAIQAEAAGHVGEHSIAIGRLERALASYVGHVVGAGSATEQLIAGLLKFSVGTLETVGVLAGLAAVVGLYELITSGAREAKKQMDDMTDSLVGQARASRAATLQGLADLKLLAEVNQQTVGKESGFGWRSILGGALTGNPQFLSGTDADRQAGRRANAQTAVDQATKNYTDAWDKAEKERTRKLDEEARKREEIARKEQEGFLRYQQIYREAYGRFAEPQTLAQRAADNRERIAYENAPSRAATNALFAPGGPLNDLVPTGKLPNVSVTDGLTDAQAKEWRLVQQLNERYEAAVKKFSSFDSALEDFKHGIKAAATTLLESLSPSNIVQNLAGGLISQVDHLVSGVISNAIGGVRHAIFGQDSAERQATREQARAAQAAALQLDALAQSLAHNNLAAAIDQLQASLISTLSAIDAAMPGKKYESERNAARARATELEHQQETQARHQDELNRRYAQEDLAVRNLRATGQGDAADRLAFTEQQQREMQKAIDEGRDATYLNTLATTQNNELMAYQNGLLETSIRNAPTGFYGIAGYLGAYATPRGYPTDSGGPITGGGTTGDTSNGGLSPRGGSRNGPITIVLTLDGKVVTKTVISNVDQYASATGGGGSSRSAAMDRYPLS